MDAPLIPVRIRRVNDDAIASLIRGLTGRRGARRLLQRIGFDAAPAVVLPPTGMPPVRAVLLTRRRTLAAWIVEVRRAIDPVVLRQVMRAVRAADCVSHLLVLVAEPRYRRIALCCEDDGRRPLHVMLEAAQPRAADIEVVRDLVAEESDEADSAIAQRLLRALDRSRISTRFFRDVTGMRNLVSRAWSGLPLKAVPERDALSLLFLSRLMFLYFLQRRGVLNRDRRFLPRLLRQWRMRPHRTSFFHARLRTLFFAVLNRRPEQRSARAREMGALPYLNGGLFEMHRLERELRKLDLPDEIVSRVFEGLLEKYRFTTSDAAEHDEASEDVGGVDPEMLGRIFEGLMPGERRERTGTFYTPVAVVNRIVSAALSHLLARRSGLTELDVDGILEGSRSLDPSAARTLLTAAEKLTVLDPACGSGAFLLGALARLSALRARLQVLAGTPCVDPLELRHDVVAHTVHGVDLLEDAALICSLRLWLALVPQRADEDVPPLPNLDRRIRQGDALVDPLDIGCALHGRPLDSTAPEGMRELVGRLAPLSAQYLGAGPELRPALRTELQRLESAVAHAWLAALDARLEWQSRDLAARADDRDLFGERTAAANHAARLLRGTTERREQLADFRREMNGAARLPFFSFRVHFADCDDGFDMILSNPPWVRAHNWPPAVRALLRERYRVCSAAGWPYAAQLAQLPGAAGAQVDLALLFLEKSCALLRPGGTLAMVLPAKLFRSLYAAGARELLLRDMHLAAITDHSLDHRAVFAADAFTAVVLAGRAESPRAENSDARVCVEVTRSAGSPLRFDVEAAELPLRRGDLRSPWLLAPPDVRAVLRAMQGAGTPAGELCTLRRGVMTGANDVLVVRDVEPKLGDLARVRAEGWHRAQSPQTRTAYGAFVEGSTLRPALRGTDISPWRVSLERHVLWTPHNDDPRQGAPPRLRRYLLRHRRRLGQDGAGIGALHRLSPHTCGHKVVWSDLAADLRAAAVEPAVRGVMGSVVPVVPLNTVYFMATRSLDESLLLCAYLNSLPFRTFARCIAERAKDVHFRFFAWTLAVLPLPGDWRSGRVSNSLLRLARVAHGTGADAQLAAEMDLLVARSYGLDETQLAVLRAFDAWLQGKEDL